jgi:uncharacterized SAM-binding protein YcdF (DUF218 family)
MKHRKFIRKQLILALLLLLIIFIEFPIISDGLTSIPQTSDTIIVLGAKLIGQKPSAVLALRLNETLRLYQNGYAPTIIVSGAKGTDEKISEAYAMSQFLVEHGVSPECIYLEENSFNTYQNLANSKQVMLEKHLHSAIIVSNTSHMHRALLIARKLGMNVTGSPAALPDNVYLTAKQYAREGAALVALTVFPQK